MIAQPKVAIGTINQPGILASRKTAHNVATLRFHAIGPRRRNAASRVASTTAADQRRRGSARCSGVPWESFETAGAHQLAVSRGNLCP
jgi:hypothetical protein